MPVLTTPALTRRGFALSALGALSLRAQTAGEVKWALLADTHVPADPSNVYRGFKPVENLKAVVPQVVGYAPHAALVCGDVARLEGLRGDYDATAALMAPVLAKTPVAMALGNHDDRKNFLAALGATQKGAQAVKDRHIVVADAGPVKMVILDSLIQPNLTPGLLGKAQRTWLKEYLASGDDTPVVLCIHHTLDDNDGSLLDAPRLFDLVRDVRKVKAIVYGHSHVYGYDTFNGIHLINLPAVGYNFRDIDPVGWVEGVFSRRGARFTLRAIAGNKDKDGQTVEVTWRT
jgi:3',5'-cyclic AMP phosphodiesterase CpdA